MKKLAVLISIAVIVVLYLSLSKAVVKSAETYEQRIISTLSVE
jgi:hypothetical protein